jgi:hypothetical protein
MNQSPQIIRADDNIKMEEIGHTNLHQEAEEHQTNNRKQYSNQSEYKLHKQDIWYADLRGWAHR